MIKMQFAIEELEKLSLRPRKESEVGEVWQDRGAVDTVRRLKEVIQESEFRTLYLEHFLRTGSPFYGTVRDEPFVKGHIIAFLGDHAERFRSCAKILGVKASVRVVQATVSRSFVMSKKTYTSTDNAAVAYAFLEHQCLEGGELPVCYFVDPRTHGDGDFFEMPKDTKARFQDAMLVGYARTDFKKDRSIYYARLDEDKVLSKFY